MDEQSVRPSKGSKHDRLTDREIRLLELLPCGGNVLKFAVSTFAREDAPCYAALSYVWAQRRTAREHMSHYPPIKVTVLLDGQPFNVNENLFHALTSVVMRLKAASADERAFERSGLGLTIRKFIWVDAICINQVDVPERNAQVASMYRTYAEATTVLVWLGREDYRSWKPGWRNNVQELADRPYWSRMWVVQEFFAARDIIIICGNHWILEQDFFQELESVEAECAAKRFADITTSARSRSEFGTQSLDHVLESYKECACSVPSDRVFALLGCIDLREQEALKLYLPNYELCYDEMVIVVLAHILRFSGKKPSIHHILLLGASIDYASKLLKIAEIFEEATRSWSSVQRLSDFEELASAKTLEIDGRAGLDDRIIYTDLEVYLRSAGLIGKG